MSTVPAEALLPGDVYLQRHVTPDGPPVRVRIIRRLLDANDMFGRLTIRYQATRLDTHTEGVVLFGYGAAVEREDTLR